MNTKAFCYATVSKKAIGIDEALITACANEVLSDRQITVVKSFIETGKIAYVKDRPVWNTMLNECVSNGISLIVIPEFSQFSHYPVEAIALVRDIKSKYGIDFFFVAEDTNTGSETADELFPLCAVMEEFIWLKNQRKKKYMKVLKGMKKNSALGSI